MPSDHASCTLLNQEPEAAEFYSEVVEGLRATPKYLPCKYLYDERGSQLFDEICLLDEYYLTRSEDQIIRRYAGEMAEQIGAGVMLVEYGSGSSTKTGALLEQLEQPAAYVPVDISREHLAASAERVSRQFPHIEVLPVCADFTQSFSLPESTETPTHAAVFFPGSTIGNFQPAAALAMLKQIASLCGRGGGLIIGVDLQKDVRTIELAYNDRQGVTAEFSLNLLRHINRKLDGDFDLDQFRHYAVYDQEHHRVKISLVSQCDQSVTIGDETFHFERQEPIVTEYSHKYTVDGFARLAAQAGLTLRRTWTDDQEMFAVLHLAILD